MDERLERLVELRIGFPVKENVDEEDGVLVDAEFMRGTCTELSLDVECIIRTLCWIFHQYSAFLYYRYN